MVDEKKIKDITKPFSKTEIKKAPQGKFGDYVPHHTVTARLNKVAFGEWSHTLKEIVRNSNGEIRAVVTTFTLWGVSHDEIGDVDNNAVKNNNTEGELLKLCMSDALKRGAMRHSIGLHLWTGDVSEEEHYASKDEVTVTKVDKRKKENKPTQEVEDVTKESIKKFEEDIGYDSASLNKNKKMLADVIAGFGLEESMQNELKIKSFNQFVEQGNDKDIEKWSNDQVGQYLDLFEQLANESAETPSDEDIVGDVFGEVTVSTERKCPECNSSEWIEDNRQKKADEPQKFGKIPSWSCNKYPQGGKNGCGWTAWGDTDCPSEWL